MTFPGHGILLQQRKGVNDCGRLLSWQGMTKLECELEDLYSWDFIFKCR